MCESQLASEGHTTTPGTCSPTNALWADLESVCWWVPGKRFHFFSFLSLLLLAGARDRISIPCLSQLCPSPKRRRIMKENKKSEIFWRQHVCRRHARKLSNKHLMPFGPTSGCWCLLVSWHRLSPTIGLLFLSLVSLSTTSGQGPTKGVMSLRNQRKKKAKTNCLKDSCGFLSSYWNLWFVAGTSSLEPDD